MKPPRCPYADQVRALELVDKAFREGGNPSNGGPSSLQVLARPDV